MLYNLNLYNIMYQLYLSKTGKNKIKLKAKISGEKYCKTLWDMLKNTGIIGEKYHIPTWECLMLKIYHSFYINV